MQGGAGVTLPSRDSPEPEKHQGQQENLFQQHIPVWGGLTPLLLSLQLHSGLLLVQRAKTTPCKVSEHPPAGKTCAHH